MDKKTPKFHHGIIAFLIAFLYLMLISPFVTAFFNSIGYGLVGIITTQIVLAAIALIFAKIIKVDFKETFPMKLPPLRQFFGAVFTYGGVYMFTISVTSVMVALFPQMQETIEDLSILTTLMPHPLVAVLVIAVMPAICEELLMRGFILHSFTEYKSIVGILAVGIMFGVLHFDLFRFIPTAILGMTSAYIVVKTKSLVLPMLYHLVNNIVSVIAMYQLNNLAETDLTIEASYSLIGSIMIYLAIALVFGYIGFSLLNEKRENQKATLIVVLTAVTIFIAGMAVVIANIDISEYYSQLNSFI